MTLPSNNPCTIFARPFSLANIYARFVAIQRARLDAMLEHQYITSDDYNRIISVMNAYAVSHFNEPNLAVFDAGLISTVNHALPDFRDQHQNLI